MTNSPMARLIRNAELVHRVRVRPRRRDARLERDFPEPGRREGAGLNRGSGSIGPAPNLWGWPVPLGLGIGIFCGLLYSVLLSNTILGLDFLGNLPIPVAGLEPVVRERHRYRQPADEQQLYRQAAAADAAGLALQAPLDAHRPARGAGVAVDHRQRAARRRWTRAALPFCAFLP